MSGLQGAASDYGQQLAAERGRLVSCLVERLAGVEVEEEEEEQHVELVESCLASLQHHKFADTNPRHVDELLDRLQERFGENVQYGKQRALQLLRAHLLERRMASTQYEVEHRVLSFLYCASRNPFGTHYLPGDLVATLEQRARNAAAGEPTYMSDASSEDSWDADCGAYSPGSHLSDWTDVDYMVDGEGSTDAAMVAAANGADTEEQEGRAVQLPAGSRGPASPTSAAAAAAAAAQLDEHPFAKLLAGKPQPQLAQRETPYTRSSLSVWLASKRSGGQPARLLEPRLCFHENELVQQCIDMLKGVDTPGAAFQLDTARDVYMPRPGVHLHSSSHGSARSLLERFAQAASAVRRVQVFCAAVLSPAKSWEEEADAAEEGGLPGWQSGAGRGPAGTAQAALSQEQRQLYALPTVAAFAAAVAEQLHGLQQQLLVIEAAFRSGELVTLLQLQQRVACLSQQAVLLAALIRRCCCWRGSGAETAAELLSQLFDALQLQLLQAGSQGGVLASMLLATFTAACRPLLITLHKWLYRGILDDPLGEFFIQATGADIPTDSPRFWSEAYTLRLAATGTPAAPCFLLRLTSSILAAGKSTLLLKAYSSWRLAAAAAAAHRGSGTTAAAAAAAAAAALAAADAEMISPSSKRRLSEYGALGFAIAAGQQPLSARSQYEQQPPPLYGMPPLGFAIADSLALLGDVVGGSSDDPGQEPVLLHQQLLNNLEAQLQALLQPVGMQAGSKAQQTQQQAQQGVPAEGQAAAGAGLEAGAWAAAMVSGAAAAANGAVGGPAASPASSSRSSSSGCSSTHPYNDEWVQASAAACDSHTLLLPEVDKLPVLPAVPASIDCLPAASVATIQPTTAAPAAAACTPRKSGGTARGAAVSAAGPLAAGHPVPAIAADVSGIGGCITSSSQRGSGVPSMAERMRQAAAARAQQAAGTAAGQAQVLMALPAPLASLAPSSAAGAGASSAACLQEAPAPVAPQFDVSSWQQWYQQVLSSLSQQLSPLAGLASSSGAYSRGRSSSSGRGAGSAQAQQQASSFGVPVCLPSYTGSAADQLWGRTPADAGFSSSSSGGPDGGMQAATAGPRQQLRPQLAADAPPLDVLLQHSLLRPVQQQVQAASGALCTALLRHGLLRQLAALRDTYLLGSPLLEPFVSFLLRRISTTGGGMERMSEFELNSSLQDALVAGGKARVLRVSAHILPASAVPRSARSAAAAGTGAGAGPGRAAGAGAGGGAGVGPAGAAAGGGGGGPLQLPPRVQQLGRLRLRVEPGWPLSLVVGEDMLGQYNSVLVLLLQLRWVKQSLQSVRYSGWKAGRHKEQGGTKRDGLQHQMVHLVDSVLQYINDRVVAAGTWLEQAMESCGSLDEMHRCRSKYLRAVTRYCLLSSDGVARLVHEGILHLLNACLQYCALHKQATATAAALRAVEAAGTAALLGGDQQQQQALAREDSGGPDGADGEQQQQPPPAAGLQRKAALQRRSAELQQQLGQLQREFSNRQRLLLRVLSTKASEAGSHADELRQLLGALDFNRFFQASMA